MKWLNSLFRRKEMYDDLAEELRLHLEERTEQFVAEGMSRPEAELAARRAFGNKTLLEERSREVWQGPLATLGNDLKMVFRRLRHAPGFAITVLLTLAIGIGANTAVFSVLNSVLFKPLPYPDAEQLVALKLVAPGAAGLADFSNGLRLSSSMYLTFSDHNRAFQSLGVWTTGNANVTGLDRPHEVKVAWVSDGVLQAFAVPPVLGRWLLAGDQIPHGPKAVVLSYGYWQQHFGGDRSVLGRTIEVDAQPREVVGVMPQGFRIVNDNVDLIGPVAFDRSKQQLPGFGYQGIARLKPGVSLTQADEDIARMLPIWMDSWSMGPGLTNADPHFYEKVWKVAPSLQPLKDEVVGNVRDALWVVMGTIAIVMLITCTNVANLLLVRADSRQQELAIRSALGAGRARIAWELLLESLCLGLTGGLLGIAVAYGGLRLLLALGPATLPRLHEISLDATSLAFTLALSLLAGLLFGSIPALRFTGQRISTGLQGSGRTASLSRERRHSRDLLVIAQVAMALVLLVSAVLMIRTFQALRRVDPGFSQAESLETLRVSIPNSLIADPQMVTRTQNNIIDRLRAIPGVRSVGFSSSVPMDGIHPNWNSIEVQGDKNGWDGPIRFFNYISPDYFKTMGTQIMAGRELTWAEIYGLQHHVLVSDNLAREVFGSPQAAIGKLIHGVPNTPWYEIVGVVQDMRESGAQEKAPGFVYWPSMADGIYGLNTFDATRAVTFVVRSDRAGTEAFLNEIRQAVWSANASLPVASLRTMQDVYNQSLARTSFTLVMLGIAGTMAFALGVVGIYGVIAYSVVQRRREIGIRLALGEQTTRLRWTFVRSALRMTAIGVVAGLCAAAVLMRLLKSVLFGVSPLDPVTYILVLTILATAAVLASYLPARRAGHVNPVEALRAE
jgi:predicted permease